MSTACHRSTMAIIFVTKIVIYAFLGKITRMWWLITGFRVSHSKEDISDCKGLRNVVMEPDVGQNKQKITKMAITWVVGDITMQRLVWDEVSAISKFICQTPVHKRLRGVTTTTNFGTKINTFLGENENMMTYNRRFSCEPFQRRHFWLRRSKGPAYR